MDFSFSDEQRQLKKSARSFLEVCSSSKDVRRAMESEAGFDESVYRRIGSELGWTSLVVPEAYGGAGFTAIDLAAVMEEMGRALLCSPFFSTVCLATPALVHFGAEGQRSEHLPALAAGERTATLAWLEPGGRTGPDGVTAVATRSGGDYVLSGRKSFVIDGASADLVLVAARAPGSHGEQGVDLFLVPGDAPGLERTPLPTMDLTRRQADVVLRGVRVPSSARLGDGAAGWGALAATLDRAAIALAAEQVGGAERCLDMAVDYAKTRVQFGRPIGSFQAIKHRCADMLVSVESARSAAYWAAWVAASGGDDLARAAALAKAWCSDAFFQVAAENIQVHGGIGFTWEHDAHLFFKRAKSSQILLGSPAEHRETVARHLDL